MFQSEKPIGHDALVTEYLDAMVLAVCGLTRAAFGERYAEVFGRHRVLATGR